MGSLAGGITRGIESNEREARERARDDKAQQLQQLQIDRIQQDVSDDQALRSAGAPSIISDASAGPMPEGQEVRMRGQGFATMTQAQAAQAGMDTPEAQDARRQTMLRAQGRGMQALQEDEAALRHKTARSDYFKQIETEGVMEFLRGNFVTAPTVADIKAGKAVKFALSGSEEFNKVGKAKIPEGAQGQWQILELGNGREEADFIVVDKDGKPVSPMSARALEGLYGMSLKERKTLEDARFTSGRDAKLKERQVASMERSQTAASNAASVRAERMGAGSRGSSVYDRMPEAEKMILKGMNTRIDLLTRSVSRDDFDSSSPVGKALMGERAKLIDDQEKLMRKYVSPAPAAPIPELIVTSTSGQSRNDGRAPEEATLTNLQGNVARNIRKRDAATPGSPEWTRLQADVDSATLELRRAGASGTSATANPTEPSTAAPALRKYMGMSGKVLTAAMDADLAASAQANRDRVKKIAEAKANAEAKAEADPDLLRLIKERKQLISAGRAVDANAKINEFNQLRMKRYNF